MTKLRSTAAIVVAIAALAVGGCSNDQPTGDEQPDRVTRVNEIDGAYETVIALQNTNATGYAQAIKKATDDPAVARFADSVIEERDKEAAILERITRGNSAVSATAAAEALGMPLRRLAISQDGKPLAAPEGDAAFVEAMRANVEAALAATEVQLDDGGPGTSQLANRVKLYRDDELAQLKELGK